MSITPSTPAETARGGFKTWVNSQRKFPSFRVSSEWKSTLCGNICKFGNTPDLSEWLYAAAAAIENPVPPACLFERAFYFRKKPNRRSNNGIVSPCTTMEKATTPNVTTTISWRSGSVGGMTRARASARAPRNPPHQRTCCSPIEIAHPPGARKEKTEQIDRQPATEEHKNNRGQKNRHSVRLERHFRD
jgi:hypothetical protein